MRTHRRCANFETQLNSSRPTTTYSMTNKKFVLSYVVFLLIHITYAPTDRHSDDDVMIFFFFFYSSVGIICGLRQKLHGRAAFYYSTQTTHTPIIVVRDSNLNYEITETREIYKQFRRSRSDR